MAATTALSPLHVRQSIATMPDWSFNTPPIHIRVGSGEDEQSFFVPEKLLIDHSEFFKAALGKPWKEQSERLVKLPEELPQHFAVFVHFVYTGRLYTVGPTTENTPTQTPEFARLSAVWLLADHLLSVTLKDAVTDALCAIVTGRGERPVDMFKTIFKSSCGHAGIHKLLVDIAVFGWGKEGFKICEKSVEHAEFWIQVAVRFAQRQDDPASTKPEYQKGEAAWCYYHDHGEGQKCYRSMFLVGNEGSAKAKN